MQPKDLRQLFLLAAIWGGSFIFMRVAVPEFGPIALIETRVSISAVFLLIVAALMGKIPAMFANWKAIAMCGFLNVVLPFFCLAVAAQTIQAGPLSIINALVPLFGGLIAWVWLGERLSWQRLTGLFIGFAGILVLVLENLSFSRGGMGWAVLIALGGPLFYGLGACHMTRYLKGVDPIACAAGSMLSATIILLPAAIFLWPSTAISMTAWVSVISLGIVCTGFAYIIFYGLISRVGASRSVTVTFLVSPFGVFWGVVLLNEPLTINVVLGAAIVLAGTLLATGFIGSK